MPKPLEKSKDIILSLHNHELRPVYTLGTLNHKSPPPYSGEVEDFGTIEGDNAIGQAIIIRLLTPKGELASLGHPDYGSRLHELVGRENTATTRKQAKMYILESLQQEKRIEKISDIAVSEVAQNVSRINVLINIISKESKQHMTIGPFNLEI